MIRGGLNSRPDFFAEWFLRDNAWMANWDDRYRAREGAGRGPEQILVEFASTLAAGQALDLACGAGRNAFWLAEHGWRVTAVDASHPALDLIPRHPNIRAVRADLERHEFEIGPSSYDLICDFYYLRRDLFPSIRSGVVPGGHFIGSIGMRDEDPDVKPMNPAYLLFPEELSGFFAGWEILHYSEEKGQAHQRKAAVIVARRRLRE